MYVNIYKKNTKMNKILKPSHSLFFFDISNLCGNNKFTGSTPTELKKLNKTIKLINKHYMRMLL